MTVPTSINILLLNIESTELQFLPTILAPLNINLVAVPTYEAALQRIQATDFAVILLNLSAPFMNALKFTESVRTGAHSPGIPIIFIDHSANADFPIDEAYSMDSIDYLPMPVSPIVLQAKIKIFIDLYGNAAEVAEKIRVSEERYRTLFNSIDEGFCTIEMLFDAQGRPIDYRFLQTNAVFEEQTGLRNPIGRTAGELVPNLEPHWYELYGKVALTGEPHRFVQAAPSMGRWFDVYAFRLGGNDSLLVAILFKDISAQKQAEIERESLLKQVQIAHAQMTDVFQKAPAFMCTLNGPEHIFENVNDNYFLVIGGRDLIGKTVREAIPEVVRQGYVKILDDVYRTGIPFIGKDLRIELQRQAEGPPEARVLDFVYLPLKDADDKVYGILVHGIDITERKRAEDGLRMLATELAQSNQHKTEFLAVLAHELRNPLAPIRNGLEVMRMSGDDPAVFTQMRDMMQRQLNQMVHLIDDLLDIARISNGKMELKKERVPLSKIVAAAIESCTPVIQANKHVLTVDVPEIPILLHADPTRLTQVLDNLLINAAKYTPTGGEISLSTQLVNDDIEIAITDNGIGIPSESLTSIFDMFTQVRNKNTNVQNGLGIGLSLVHRLVELHDGSVVVHSDGAGKGSTFVVRLPLINQGEAAQPVAELTTDINPTPNIKTASELQRKSLRILVADDNVDAAESLVSLFQLLGHQTHVVYDGVSAYQAAQYFHPHVAFLDIGMPGMNGNEVAAAIKNSPDISRTLLVALTGWGTTLDRAESKIAGFDHHLTKPMDIEVVKKLLAEFA